jgi:hypothetical protein
LRGDSVERPVKVDERKIVQVSAVVCERLRRAMSTGERPARE